MCSNKIFPKPLFLKYSDRPSEDTGELWLSGYRMKFFVLSVLFIFTYIGIKLSLSSYRGKGSKLKWDLTAVRMGNFNHP